MGFTCTRCGSSYRGIDSPPGWGLIGSDWYCPNCLAEIAAQRDAREAAYNAKCEQERFEEEQERIEARRARAAYYATPKGRKERNIASLSIVISVLLFFLFAGVFHLISVAIILGLIASIPFFWYRARKIGFLILVLVILVIVAKINKTEDNGNNASITKNSEVISKSNSEKRNQTKPKVSKYLVGVDNINDGKELSQFYFNIASKFSNNQMGLKGDQEQIDAGNKLMSNVYSYLGRRARNMASPDINSMELIIQDFPNVSTYRKKKALEELHLGIDKISAIQVKTSVLPQKKESQSNSVENKQSVTLKKAMKEIIPVMKAYKEKIEAYMVACPNGCREYPYWAAIGFDMPESDYFEFLEGPEGDFRLDIDSKRDVLGVSCYWQIRCFNKKKCLCNVSEECKDFTPNLKSVCDVEYDSN